MHDGPTMVEWLRHQLPHARVELVDDANHLILIDRPRKLTDDDGRNVGGSNTFTRHAISSIPRVRRKPCDYRPELTDSGGHRESRRFVEW